MLRFRDIGILEQGSLAKLGNQFLSKLPHLSFEASEECDDEHQIRKIDLEAFLEAKCLVHQSILLLALRKGYFNSKNAKGV